MRQTTGPVGRIHDALWKLTGPTNTPGTATDSRYGFAWATVTAAYPDPVQVLIDTEDERLAGVPAMLCTVGLGDRVLLLMFGRRVIVLGVAQPDQSRRLRQQFGLAGATSSAANTPTTTHVAFDVPFDQSPTVTLTAYTSRPDLVAVSIGGVTADGFDIILVRPDTTTTAVSWIALT